MRLHVLDITQPNDQSHKTEKSSSILWIPKGIWPGQVCAPGTDVEAGTGTRHEANRALQSSSDMSSLHLWCCKHILELHMILLSVWKPEEEAQEVTAPEGTPGFLNRVYQTGPGQVPAHTGIPCLSGEPGWTATVSSEPSLAPSHFPGDFLCAIFGEQHKSRHKQ